MKLRVLCLVLMVGAFAAPAAAGASEDARLRGGAIVAEVSEERGPGGRVHAVIDIEAPASAIWRVMLDCARAPDFVPGLEACRILETAPDASYDLREHRVRFMALMRVTFRFRSEYVREREIRFVRTGGDLAVLEGAWRLEPLDDGARTRVRYTVRMAPRTPVPASLVRGGLLRDTRRVMEALRAEVLRTAGD